MKDLTDKQLRDRMRFLSDKIEDLWTKIRPTIDEFNECRMEFNEIVNELVDRGAIEDASE